MLYILSVDPGKVTGVAYGCFGETSPYDLMAVAAVLDGPYGLNKWLVEFLQQNPVDVIVSELFVPDGSAGGRETVSPRCEGVLISHFEKIVWQRRTDKTWGGMGAKAVDQRLKDLGLWRKGSEVAWSDGRDVNDAIIHALNYLRVARHMPTLKMIHKETP